MAGLAKDSFAFIDNRYDATGGFIKGQTLVVSQEIDSAVGVAIFPTG